MNCKKNRKIPLWWGIIIWAVLVLLFFAPAVFGGKVLAPVDCVECLFKPFATQPMEEVHNQYNVDGASQYLPYSWAMQQSWQSDGYMGWNPYTHNGTSLPENTMLSPGDWHHWLFGFLPFWTAWDAGILLQFFIAGLGMIILLKSRGIPIPYVLLGAVSFSFYSQFIMWIYDRWLGGIIWAPLIVWSLLEGRRKNKWVHLPSILFIALGFRGGHLQACLFVFLLVLCVFLADWWKRADRWSWKVFLKSSSFYLISGFLAALLSLDVFVDTLPRMEGCKSLPFVWGLENIPFLATSVMPTLFGIPQTISISKVIGADLFDIKFGGGVVFVLAVLALFNRRAPLTAKFCFLVSLIVSCTPLSTFLYSRSTVVMAFGMSWLAGWQLFDLRRHPVLPIWRRLVWWGIGILCIWLAVSVAVQCFHEPLLLKLHSFIDGNITTSQQKYRHSWYLLRSERLLDQLMIWDWRNALLILLVSVGGWACSRLNISSRYPKWWAGLVVLCTFGEQIVFSSSWIAYSDKPESGYLYKEPEWMSEFRGYVGDGAVVIVNPHNDLDFLCTNHLSTYGIRLASGYETVQPRYLRPLSDGHYYPKDYAMAGISHLLCDAKAGRPSFDGWNLVQETEDFFLLENPLYRGRYFVRTQGEKNHFSPVVLDWRTNNKIHVTVPPGTKELSVLESYSRGWSARTGKGEELPLSSTERYSILVSVPDSEQQTEILLQYHTPYREWYYSMMGGTALFLLVAALLQRRVNIRTEKEG